MSREKLIQLRNLILFDFLDKSMAKLMGTVAPEMKKIELGKTCTRAKMIGYKFLHRLLSSLSSFKINLL
jgi:hypothetical protein